MPTNRGLVSDTRGRFPKIGFSRRFSGKVYQRENREITGWNKQEAERRAKALRAKGYLVRVVPSSRPYDYGYSVWWRAEKGHGY